MNQKHCQDTILRRWEEEHCSVMHFAAYMLHILQYDSCVDHNIYT